MESFERDGFDGRAVKQMVKLYDRANEECFRLYELYDGYSPLPSTYPSYTLPSSSKPFRSCASHASRDCFTLDLSFPHVVRASHSSAESYQIVSSPLWVVALGVKCEAITPHFYHTSLSFARSQSAIATASILTAVVRCSQFDTAIWVLWTLERFAWPVKRGSQYLGTIFR
jgi:hypothetical protein